MDRCFGAAARPGETCEPKAPSIYLDAHLPVLVVRCHPFSFSFLSAWLGLSLKPHAQTFLRGRFLLFMAGGLSQHPAVIFLFAFTLRLHSQSPQQTAATVKFLSSSVNCGCIIPFSFATVSHTPIRCYSLIGAPVCVQPCLPREFEFLRVSFLFMNRLTLSWKDLLKATPHSGGSVWTTCLQRLHVQGAIPPTTREWPTKSLVVWCCKRTCSRGSRSWAL